MKTSLFAVAEQTRADAYPQAPSILGFAPLRTIYSI